MFHILNGKQHLTRIECAAGRVQLVAMHQHILLDVQGYNKGVDGIERPTHGATILREAQALELRDALTRVVSPRQPDRAAA